MWGGIGVHPREPSLSSFWAWVPGLSSCCCRSMPPPPWRRSQVASPSRTHGADTGGWSALVPLPRHPHGGCAELVGRLCHLLGPQRLASPQTSGVSSTPDLGGRGRGASVAAPPAPLLPFAWPLPSSRLRRYFPRKASVAALRAGRPGQRTGWDPTGGIQIRCHHLPAPGSTEYSERRGI